MLPNDFPSRILIVPPKPEHRRELWLRKLYAIGILLLLSTTALGFLILFAIFFTSIFESFFPTKN